MPARETQTYVVRAIPKSAGDDMTDGRGLIVATFPDREEAEDYVERNGSPDNPDRYVVEDGPADAEPYRVTNPRRGSRGFYQADLERGGDVVGTVIRAARGGGGYRASDYHARVGSVTIATGRTIADLKAALADEAGS